MPRHHQIAIDGPAGAGKSTVARAVAERLGYTFVDTGAMYRCVALAMLRSGLTLDDAAAVGELAERLQIEFGPLQAGQQPVSLDGQEVTAAIRTPEVHAVVSPVSAIPAVRAALLRQQQAYGEQGPVVMEGRDIQTVVLPAAQTKVYLDASPAERARRRHAELPPGSGSVGDVEAAIRERDARDSGRANAPLRAAPEAVHLLTDGLSVEQVIERILDLARAAVRAGGSR
ncbi:MAG: (d)CMP kinase [Fimbriimonadaceae bacterium]|nr:(d)CMP kinase [Fimbriimonadaceae bacterium]